MKSFGPGPWPLGCRIGLIVAQQRHVAGREKANARFYRRKRERSQQTVPLVRLPILWKPSSLPNVQEPSAPFREELRKSNGQKKKFFFPV